MPESTGESTAQRLDQESANRSHLTGCTTVAASFVQTISAMATEVNDKEPLWPGQGQGQRKMPAKELLSMRTLCHHSLRPIGSTAHHTLQLFSAEEWDALEPSSLPEPIAWRVSTDCALALAEPLFCYETALNNDFAAGKLPVVDYGFDRKRVLMRAVAEHQLQSELAQVVQMWCLFHADVPCMRSVWSTWLDYDNNAVQVKKCVTVHNLPNKEPHLHTHGGQRFDPVMPPCPFWVSYEGKNFGLHERDITLIHDLPLLPEDERGLRNRYLQCCGSFLRAMQSKHAIPLSIASDIDAFKPTTQEQEELRQMFKEIQPPYVPKKCKVHV